MPSLTTTTFLALAASSANLVLGHGHVHQVIANGKTYKGYTPWRDATSDMVGWTTTTEDEGPVPVAKLQHSDIICHLGATNAASSVPVNAGESFQIKYIGGRTGFSHPGSELHYLAPCGDSGCAKVDKTDLKFFKIYELGLVQGGKADSPEWETQKWATTEIHKKYAEGTTPEEIVDTYTVNIPKDIKPGEYVLRHELIALHMAESGVTEFYPGCVNLVISGSGSVLPEGISATEFYSASDPGIDVDIWQNLQSYEIPGPPVANFAASSNSDSGSDSGNGSEEEVEAPTPTSKPAATTMVTSAVSTSTTAASGQDDEPSNDDEDEEEYSCRRRKGSRARRHIK